jgi:RNA-directed DNA polymerase
VNLIRYADDFIITGSARELLENEVKPLVEQFLRDRGLQLSPEKTCVTHIETGFDFLGQNVRKFGGTLLIQPSRKNTHAFLDKMRQVIRLNRGYSDDPGMGLLPSPYRGQTDVQESGLGFVA